MPKLNVTCENELAIPAELRLRDVRIASSIMKEKIEFRGYDRININMTNTLECFPDTMLPLIALIRKYQAEGIRFRLDLPTAEWVSRLIINSNWAHLIDPRQHAASEDPGKFHLPAKVFKTGIEQHRLVNSTLDRLLRTVSFLDRNHLQAFEWAINEITDNVLIHAEAETGGLLQLAVKSVSKEIQVIVADSGLGIPNSLRNHIDPNMSDERVLEEAVKEGVTRGTGQGNGLYGSLRISTLSGGAFSLNSGYAFYSLAREGRIAVRHSDEEFPGTSVDCTISFAKPLLLEEALKFRGQPHQTYGILDEMVDQSDDGIFTFFLCDEATSIGSRLAGYELRQKILTISRMLAPERILLDFRNLGVISSSFADEFFVKLVQIIGIERSRNCLMVRNLGDLNAKIIDRSMHQRLGSSYFRID